MTPSCDSADPRLHFVYVPTPGDHYSPATGSALITVISQFTRQHEGHGHSTRILVSQGTTKGYTPYPDGETIEIPLAERPPSKSLKLIDSLFGRLCHTRPFAARSYAAVAQHLTESFDGTLIILNAPAAIPYLRRRLPKANLVLYAHNQLFNTYSDCEICHVLSHLDTLLCVSDFIANDIKMRSGEDSPKIRVVLNGVDTTAFTPASQPPPGPPVILFTGRIQEIKGPHLLLKAAMRLASPKRPFKVRIVGSSNFDAKAPLTPYEQSLRELARPIADRVEFCPFVPRTQIAQEYRNASIFVAPSCWDEPFGLTIAEALASGLPTVVSCRGGIPEIGLDTVRYFSPPNIETLSNDLKDLLDDPSLRGEMSSQVRARSLEISWERQYEVLLGALGLAE